MHKRILIGCILIIFLLCAVPPSLANKSKTGMNDTFSPISSNRTLFTSCYIEASGYVSEIDWPAIIKMPNMWKTTWFRPFNDNRAIMTYWQIVFDSSVEMSIFDKEGGQLLWEHSDSSHEQIRIIGYYGIYISSNPDEGKPLYIDMSGNALVVFRTAR